MIFVAITPRGKSRLEVSSRQEAERVMSSFPGDYEILPGDPGDITWSDLQLLKREFGEEWEEAAHALGKRLAYLYVAE